MGTTVKPLRKVAYIIESSPGVFLPPDTLSPFTSFAVKQNFDMIDDESIVGEAFQGLPNQGVRKIEGTLAGQLEVDAIIPLLEAAFGSESSQVFSAPTTINAKSLSIVHLDEVKTNKYAGCRVKSLTIASSAEEGLTFSADIIGEAAEVRDGTAFPTISTNPGSRLLHHHANGSGHIRIADQVDALAAGDNRGLSSMEVSMAWNFDHQFDNQSQGTLPPLSTATGFAEAGFAFQIARHTDTAPSADDFLVFRDSFTSLQAELLFFRSATANMKIEISNFVVKEASVNEDDIAKLDVVTMAGRNGLSGSFDNSNMAFNTPIRITIDNS